MALTTTTYRRDTPAGPEAFTVMASLDDDGAEIRVIHERAGEVIEDSIPHWGADPAAGAGWLAEHRDALLAGGYRAD